MGGQPAWDFFLSYASADREAARQLHALLQPDLRVFFDQQSLPLGLPFDGELIDALKRSRSTLVLVSGKSSAAFYQREEVARAVALMKATAGRHRVVPVFLDAGSARPDNVGLLGVSLLQGLTVGDGGLPAVAARLRQLAGEWREDANEAPAGPAAAQNGHPLHDYPAWGRIESFRIRQSLIAAVAETSPSARAPLAISEANAFRVEADPTDADASVIRAINLPDPGAVSPLQFWIAAFTEARLQGPRMLAALLVTVPDAGWSAEARRSRDALLEHLRSL